MQSSRSDSRQSAFTYIPALDGLRFLAFFLVFLHHTLPLVVLSDPDANRIKDIIQHRSWVGVDLFFILSGFLITAILLHERNTYGTYSIRNFYIRRCLRIWPLYFLMLLLGYFVLPIICKTLGSTGYSDVRYQSEIVTQSPLYVSFLGNWAVVINGYSKFPFIAHLWTVSVEEQFYLIWPVLLLFMKTTKRFAWAFTLLLSIPAITRSILFNYDIEHPGVYANTFARIDTIAIGAIIAVIYMSLRNPTNSLSVAIAKRGKSFFMSPIQLIMAALLILFLSQYNVLAPGPIAMNAFGFLIQNALIAYFLTVSLLSDTWLAKVLSLKIITFLGKISYGLYVFHVSANELSVLLLSGYVPNYWIPMIAFVLTVTLASMSYYLFERGFLQLKYRYSSVFTKPV
jgi:peptidoglycan/LPS O-acetylase OafA/YrhL